MTCSRRKPRKWIRPLAAALLVLAAATAEGAGAGAVGGPQYGIVRVDGCDLNHEVAQQPVDACLRDHGWRYGWQALRRTELRVGHPNALSGSCSAQPERKAVHTSVEGRTRHA
jgi:hypothetical protein